MYFLKSCTIIFLIDPSKRRTHDDGLAEGEDLEKRLENMDVYLSTRKQFGAKKIWSERLEVDLMRASMWRISRRPDLKKKMRRPYMAYDDKEGGKWEPKANWLLGETKGGVHDVTDKKTWYAVWSTMALTVMAIIGYFLSGGDERQSRMSKSEPRTWRTYLHGGELTDYETATKEGIHYIKERKDSNVNT